MNKKTEKEAIGRNKSWLGDVGYAKETNYQHNHHFYFLTEIGAPEHYLEMLNVLRRASSIDKVFLHFNTPGGYVSTGMQLINGMRDSHARITGVLEGEACSMGALMFLACDDFQVHQHSLLMFHNYSSGTHGKGHELKSYVEATDRMYSAILQDVSKGFLTKREIDKVLAGGDLYYHNEEITQRLKDMKR